MQETPYCLVLGGGGAKGVYHMGVWQALQELDIPVNAFIGNSIGAVMAAFFASGGEQNLSRIADSIQLKSLVRLNDEEYPVDEETFKGQSLGYWQGVYKKFVQKRGIDTSPMRELLEDNLDEVTLRSSGLDFGITTVNVSDFEPREVYIEAMEPDQLISYVMASAAFPGFQKPIIDGKKYVDGGLYSNVPYSMAKRRGYRKIILVDISGIGINRRPKTDGTQTVFIKNSIDMGNAFDFDPEFIRKFRILGYLDTLRTFGQLIGYQYFIEPNAAVEKSLLENRADLEAQLTSLYSVFPEHMSHDRRHALKLLEVCATLFEIERIEQYSYSQLSQCIYEQIMKTEDSVQSLLKARGLDSGAPSHKLIEAFMREFFNGQTWTENPYFYQHLLTQFKPSKTLNMAESTLLKLDPELKLLNVFRALPVTVFCS